MSVLCDENPPTVRVVARAAGGLRPPATLLRELNDIQLRALSASVCWHDGNVVVFQTVSPVGLTRPVVVQALDGVRGVAEDVGVLLAGMFGGTTPFPPDVPTDEEVP